MKTGCRSSRETPFTQNPGHPQIWVVDLGGDGRGTQQDDNVFAIQTPVAITIAVRYNQPQPTIPAHVHYTRISGTRAEKLSALDGVHTLADLKFWDCLNGWDEPFRPHDSGAAYFDWPKLIDLMPWQHSGVEAKRTWPTAPTRGLLEERWKSLLGATDRASSFKESTDRLVTGKYKSLWGNDADETPIAALDGDTPCPTIMPLWHRTLDRQFVIADNRLLARSRESLWKVDSAKQLYFAASFTSSAITVGPALTLSIGVPDRHYFNGRGGKDIIPLFRDNNASLPNLHPDLLRTLAGKLQTDVSAQDWACYLYGVVAQAGYTSRFKAELASRDVRVPITLDLLLFEQAISLGKQLLFLHSYGERFDDEFLACPARQNVCMVSKLANLSIPSATMH